jgi:hypothetical protein
VWLAVAIVFTGAIAFRDHFKRGPTGTRYPTISIRFSGGGATGECAPR